jgi:Methyltransferase domain
MIKHFGLEQKTVLLSGFFSHLSSDMREELKAHGDVPEQEPIVGEQIGTYAPYDLAFIDGDHYADAVTRDLLILHPYLSQNAIIVLHDVSSSTSWGGQVLAGVGRFIHERPDFSLKVDHNLGFLSRDIEKAWLIPQSNPLMGRVRRRVLRAGLDVAALLK